MLFFLKKNLFVIPRAIQLFVAKNRTAAQGPFFQLVPKSLVTQTIHFFRINTFNSMPPKRKAQAKKVGFDLILLCLFVSSYNNIQLIDSYSSFNTLL